MRKWFDIYFQRYFPVCVYKNPINIIGSKEQINIYMRLINIHLYNYIILYAKNCDLILKKDGCNVYIPHGDIMIVEKKINFDLYLIRREEGVLYEYLEIDESTLSLVRRILEPVIAVHPIRHTERKRLRDRFFEIPSCPITIRLFECLKSEQDNISRVYQLAHLISKCNQLENLAMSIYRSSAVSFSEKISKLLFADLSKKWTISTVAEIMHTTEISLRKKLESESITFYQLLLNIRMHQAAKFIINGDKQISVIALLVGYSSVSNFIKAFKSYYGITPKQFHMGIKENIGWM